MSSLPAWPPACDADHRDRLVKEAVDWALGHALVLRTPAAALGGPPSSTSVVHGPITLLPTPFPRQLFEEAVRVQTPYNALYAHISCDKAFLTKVIGQAVARVDEFQGRLWALWQQVTDEGIAQVRT
jgi:glutathione synthase